MNTIEIDYQDIPEPQWLNQVEKYSSACLEALSKNNVEVSILFCSKQIITELNVGFRSKEGPTDVLSFASCDDTDDFPDFIATENPEQEYLGDIAICPEIVSENAQAFQEGFYLELSRVILHGLLHLCGQDHQSNEAHEPMLMYQEAILKELLAKGQCIQ